MGDCFYINGSVPPQTSKVMKKPAMRTVRGKSAMFALFQANDKNEDFEVPSFRFAAMLQDAQDKLLSVNDDSRKLAYNDFLLNANGELCSFAAANSLEDYGASAAVLEISGGVADVVSIGNVMCYHKRHGEVKLLTRVPEAQKTAAVGGVAVGETPAHYTSEHVEVDRDDVFMLCSAGITDYVSEQRLSYILSLDLSDERMVRRITGEAIAKGSERDITVVLVRNGGKPIRSKKLIKAGVAVIGAVVILSVLSAFFSSQLVHLFRKPEISEEPSSAIAPAAAPAEFIQVEDPKNPIPPEPYTPTEEDEEETEETEGTEETEDSGETAKEATGSNEQ